ncbi:hypothetical protein FB451DRAFT_1125557 [Mycena latifolia]|nr:hypothetical protein FB451DRAFT_1125557 [Mycena latifolia]
MLDDLRTWSFGNDPESRVLWLHGPAGAGKSAIAQSFCQKLESEGRLGGSFFFKRGHPSRGNASKLFPTLAYQLAVLLPEFKRGVIQRVEEDPSIVDKSHSIQLQKLIIEPFQDTGLTLTLIMVIDGLDECQGQDIQQEVLRSIGNSFQRSHLPLRLLVASRPEPHIVEVFRRSYFTGFHRPLNIQKSLEDVRRYLQDGFRQIHREHWITMATVSSPWPSQEVINHLVEKSSGYFIYASTVIKFIDDKNFCPAERLEIIMGIAEPESESPFAALDQLYIQILAAVPSRSQLLRILTVITSGLISSSVARHHGGQRRSEIAFVQQLLDLKSGGVLLALRGLHSVIKVDEDATQFPRGPELNVYHASFLDFLNDSTRSGVFYVGGAQRTQLACDILKTFCYTSHDPTANSQNREGHLAWKLGPEGIAYLSSARPSSELLSRLHAVNPDFLFYGESMREPTEKVLDLLKEIRPQPQDLIQLWEDYCFMLLNADLWGDTYERRGNVSHGQLDHCQMVLQACPQVSRYFHAFRLVFNKWELNSRPLGIFDIRLLLNWSWDDTIAAFSRLRAILGPNSSQKVRGLLTYVFSADSVLSRKFCSSLTLRDLARTCLRTMKRLVANNFRWEPIHRSIGVWTYLLRSCPPCPDLLDELALVSSSGHIFHYFAVDDIYNVVQWLKMFPQCPAELIARYEQHLETILMANTMLGAMYYWRKWQKNLTQCDCFALQSNCGS